ncbi:conserved hypothetical protein [Coccidioides posadasii str. Silveira]|uniref:Uncharacterized protein n=1 Tax=Coccidioides posadasii (strain RMSCC 757 / Silveira) TaxID=443226 RepID=E9DA10_COCPS|nr:conserved hypothetical protein [Coccidioides posadasii str. Silveira]
MTYKIPTYLSPPFLPSRWSSPCQIQTVLESHPSRARRLLRMHGSIVGGENWTYRSSVYLTAQEWTVVTGPLIEERNGHVTLSLMEKSSYRKGTRKHGISVPVAASRIEPSSIKPWLSILRMPATLCRQQPVPRPSGRIFPKPSIVSFHPTSEDMPSCKLSMTN